MNETYIYKYFEGTCTAEELKELKEWIAASDENARHFFRTEQLYHLGKRDAEQEKERTQKAENALAEKIGQLQTKKKKIYQLRWFQYAAIIVTVFTLGGLWYGLGHTAASNLQEIMADSHAIKHATLPDGTQVWLNHNSKISFPKDFVAQDQRIVNLQGEAYFQVAKHENLPFIVKNDLLEVKVLGTVFNLKCDAMNQTASATLIEGTIEVKGNNEEGSVTLTPGQEADINAKTHCLTVKQVNAKMNSMWHKQMIPFDQNNIQEIASKLEHYYPIKISLDPGIDLNSTYSGAVKQTSSIDSVLKSLKNAIPIDYTVNDNNIYITNKKINQRK